MVPEKFDNFIRYTHKKTTMKYGYYYDAIFDLPFAKENKRHIRVWLPENYDFSNPSKRFPVLYMSDGQNLVNKYLTKFGDWELDKVIHNLKLNNLPTPILVGVDCPKDEIERVLELNPPYPSDSSQRFNIEHGYGNKFLDFIVLILKPIIDELFFTRKEKEYTGIGGSSMGGIMAFYGYFYHPETFSFSLSFSPAFLLYRTNTWKNILKELTKNRKPNDGKLYIYTGGEGFESHFVSNVLLTSRFLKKEGYKPSSFACVLDSRQIHHESAWNKYSYDALSFWLKDIK